MDGLSRAYKFDDNQPVANAGDARAAMEGIMKGPDMFSDGFLQSFGNGMFGMDNMFGKMHALAPAARAGAGTHTKRLDDHSRSPSRSRSRAQSSPPRSGRKRTRDSRRGKSLSPSPKDRLVLFYLLGRPSACPIMSQRAAPQTPIKERLCGCIVVTLLLEA